MLVRNSTHKNTRKRLVRNSGHSKVNGKKNHVKAGSQVWTQQSQRQTQPSQSWLAILDTATAKRTTAKLDCNTGHSNVNGKKNHVQSWLAILDTEKSTANITKSKLSFTGIFQYLHFTHSDIFPVKVFTTTY